MKSNYLGASEFVLTMDTEVQTEIRQCKRNYEHLISSQQGLSRFNK